MNNCKSFMKLRHFRQQLLWFAYYSYFSYYRLVVVKGLSILFSFDVVVVLLYATLCTCKQCNNQRPEQVGV